nr:ATP-binding cassette domain-containing protein [uncultured Cohaesibacter sp.]
MTTSIIDIQNVRVQFGGGFLTSGKPFIALKDTSLSVRQGSAHGLVGESGSGKTTLGRVVLGLVKPVQGDVLVANKDISALKHQNLLSFRRKVQCVFQDSLGSLDPRMSVGASVREGLDIHKIGNMREREDRVAAMLERVGLSADYRRRFPHELSGGQRQRVNIARALIVEPSILVADEPVSSLDVSIQAQVLDLLVELQDQFQLTVLFISHDLHVVREVCESVSVMRRGQIVEEGLTEDVFNSPAHDYTRMLLNAI